MTIDTTLAKEPGHYCQLPEIETWEFDDSPREGPYDFRPPRLIERLAEDTRFHCECGRTFVVTWNPGSVGPHIVIMGRWEWCEETRRQRRQRLRAERKKAKQ